MAEGPMKLISFEHPGPMSAKFSFSINSLEADNFTSPFYKVHNIAGIQFLLKRGSDGQTYYFIKVIKSLLANELGIQLQIVCKEPEYNISLPCTENWSKWQNMGLSKYTSFNVEFDVKMSKADSVVLKLYKDVKFTDFQLSTAKGSVAVHKAQMAAHSEVFNTMLSREWKETTEGRIKMEGVTLQTLKHLKTYMYLGALPPVNGLCPLLLIARCYLMDNLKADCLTKLTQTVTSENLYDILEFSFLNKFPEVSFAVLGAMSKKMVDDARKMMTENQKSCDKAENDKMAEQEPSKEETND